MKKKYNLPKSTFRQMKLQQKWSQLRTAFHGNLISKVSAMSPLMARKGVDTVDHPHNPYLKDLENYTSWCQEKLVRT